MCACSEMLSIPQFLPLGQNRKPVWAAIFVKSHCYFALELMQGGQFILLFPMWLQKYKPKPQLDLVRLQLS